MIKVTYITHACLLVKVKDVNIITDPWLLGPSWGNSLWHFPPNKINLKDLPCPDIIFFSHGHEDHYHRPTIKSFPKKWLNAEIIVPNFDEQDWKIELRKKFKHINYVNHNNKIKIKDISFQVFLNDLGDYDSSLKISYKNNNIFLQTDNLMSAKEAYRIGNLEKIDAAFVMPFLTGIYPSFYNWEIEKKIQFAKEKTIRSMEQSYKIVRNLNPKVLIPYASDLGYMGNNFDKNLIQDNNKKQYLKYLKRKKIKSKMSILNPKDELTVNQNKINFKTSRYNHDLKSFLEFNEIHKPLYFKLLNEEKKLENQKNFQTALKKFRKSVIKNFKNIKNMKYTVKIIIRNNFKIKKIIDLNFKSKKFNFSKKDNENKSLKINIDEHKFINLAFNKYPYNFYSLINGCLNCERKSKKLSKNEIYFWDWLNNLNFNFKN